MQVAGRAPRDVYEWQLTARAGEIRQWRRRAVSVVERWNAETRAMELAAFGVTELLTNVIKHVADPHCHLLIAKEGRDFRITVRDRSKEAPAVRVPDWDSESGRGLWLLREMVRDLGYICFPGGKAVWFRCPLGSTSPVPSGWRPGGACDGG
ncbi:ATP-binding protein [Streptomyces marincola]|uniref:Histidine kinase/HSP90-like ATPase domain-containing protein n=1 Tax=Streptomyces marincola TaxID=2878388 RepID=A0A1W7CSM4_9ACTN|nr:hypothetical protein CAG99_01900 [Streptomyces marincola]